QATVVVPLLLRRRLSRKRHAARTPTGKQATWGKPPRPHYLTATRCLTIRILFTGAFVKLIAAFKSRSSICPQLPQS
ncbi:MAG: hypothetical protein QNJ47_28280, partial [Nostocaceae cyanobacterium]|nr:hypothetical protein [Nostocaceae cyanobacterium]